MTAKQTGDDYAEATLQRLEGRPLPNIHRLIADAFNAGYVQALMDRRNRSGGLRLIEPPHPRLGGLRKSTVRIT